MHASVPAKAEIFGARLRQARKMGGLSLRELSDKIGNVVSHTALANYETGDSLPNSAVLSELCRALDKRSEFFFRKPTLKLSNIRFRKMARLSKAAEDAIKDMAVDYFERYAEIEHLLGIEQKFMNPLKRRRISSVEEAEAAANDLRTEWKLGLDPIPSAISLLETHGIKVYETAAEDRLFDGLCAQTDAGPVIVIASWLNDNKLRKRMTLIHELAHILLRMTPEISEKAEEKIVARFAGALLLPEAAFKEQFGQHRSAISLNELIQLKLFFGASITAMMMRAKHFDLISEAQFKRFWAVYGGKWRRDGKEPGDDDYGRKEHPNRFRMLVLRAVAEEQISISKGASLLDVTLGDLRRDLDQIIA